MRPSLVAIVVLGALTSIAHGRKTVVAPLRVCATTSTIADLVRAVGGDGVAVTLLGGPAGLPRKAATSPAAAVLAQSQLVVLNGDGAEAAWLTDLLAAAPSALRPGGRGHLDASRIEAASECAPDELLDPMRALGLADAIRAKLEALRPAGRRAFTDGYETFRARLAAAMLGDRLGTKYPIEKVADMLRRGTLDAFLAAQHESDLLGGWFGTLRAAPGVKAAADRAGWGCFARRFGIEIVMVDGRPAGQRPGDWRAQGIRLLLVGLGHQRLRVAAKRNGVPIASLVGQVGSVPGANDYVSLLDYDVRAVGGALRLGSKPPPPGNR